MQYTAPTGSLELAPYAIAPTSILVYRGRGTLVRRCRSREEAVQLAIEEFSLQCDPRSVSLTTFVGVQGREVEVGRSAFAFLKDTIPIHVHVKEEEASDDRETARWPAVSLDPQPLEYFGESVLSTLPTQLLQDGLESISKQNNTDSSQSYTQTLEESVSDWRKGSSATSVTATSVHETPQEGLPTVKSPDEMTVSNASLPDNSLMLELPVEMPEQPQANGHKPKNWDWLKKAGAAIGVGQGKSETAAQPLQAKGPIAARSDKATSVEEGSEDGESPAPITRPKASIPKLVNPSKIPPDHGPSRQQSAPNQSQGMPKATKRQSLVSNTKSRNREPSPKRAQECQKSRPNRPPPSEPVSPSVSGESAVSDWGPGGLVLEEDGSTWQTDSVASSKVDGSWWAKSAPSIGSTSSTGKVPLRPLRLPTRSGSIATSNNDGFSEGGRSNISHSRSKKSPTFKHRTRPSPLSSPRESRQRGGPRNCGSSPARSPLYPEPSRARPMPDDLPESPASSRRFTKAADQMDAFTLQQAPKRMPKGKSDDSIPLVPIAPPAVPLAAGRKAQNRRSGLVAKHEAPRNDQDWPSTPTADPPVAAVQPKRTPQRPRRQPTGNDIWTKQGLGAVPAFHGEPLPKKQRDIHCEPLVEAAKDEEPPAKARLPHHAIQGGHFARAAFAARRQMSSPASERSPTGSTKSAATASSQSSVPSTQSGRSTRQDKRGDMRPTHAPARQRSSLSSIQDFVPAEVQEEEDSIAGTSLQSGSQAMGTSLSASKMTGTTPTGTEAASGSGSWMSGSSLPSIAESEGTVQESTSWATSSTIPAKAKGGKVQRAASILSQSTALSRDSYAAGEADTVFLDRVILGPMQLSSPNRKGSQLVLKASPTTSQLSVEWKQEKKTVVGLGFNALASVALPGPDCKEKFIILRPKTGQVKEVLLELDKGNLLHFQRFILIIIMGEGAEIEHLQEDEFLDIVEANGW